MAKTDFTWTRAQFALPEGVIYLDGNSLGPLPRTAAERVARTVTDEWGEMLITGWNKAGWMAAPMDLGDRVGRLIGAAPGTTVIGDTLSIKVYQALASALSLADPDRRIILSDTGNFPSDLYMAQGLIDTLDRDYELRVVSPETVAQALTSEVAVMMLTQIDYRTGRRHDMEELTAQAHSVGALTIWDLAHSAGAIEVDLTGADADFAVGCTYKYLNAGPGAPAFITIAPRHADIAKPALAGWLGHDAPFAFEPAYRPGEGVARMRVGTPPILQCAALEAALDIFDRVDMADVRARSIELSERFISGVEARCPGVVLNSPRPPELRGSQVSFRHPEGYAVMQALIDRGVIGDFRAPDNLRFGITPLYLTEADIDGAVGILADILDNRLWDRDGYKRRAMVT